VNVILVPVELSHAAQTMRRRMKMMVLALGQLPRQAWSASVSVHSVARPRSSRASSASAAVHSTGEVNDAAWQRAHRRSLQVLVPLCNYAEVELSLMSVWTFVWWNYLHQPLLCAQRSRTMQKETFLLLDYRQDPDRICSLTSSDKNAAAVRADLVSWDWSGFWSTEFRLLLC